MAERRIQALALLVRLSRRAMEEQAAQLGAVNRKIAALRAERSGLLEGLRAQAGTRDIETARYFPAYLRSVRAEEARLTAVEARLIEEARRIEVTLAERFRTLKAQEGAHDQAREAARSRAERMETALRDEQALIRWERARRAD